MGIDLPSTLPGLEPLNTSVSMPNPANFGQKSEKEKNIFNEPNNLSGWEILGKTAIGLIIGGIIAALLFVVLSFVGSMFSGAMGQGAGVASNSNPLLPIILLFIAFLSTFIGNISVAGVYNLFFSKKYYDGSKIFGLLLLTNGLLFFIVAPIYIVFSSQLETLFIIMGLHVVFSILVSACQIEFSANPNYSASALMGNVAGFAGSMLIYSLFYKSSFLGGSSSQIYLRMLLPPVVGYAIIPLGAGIWEKIYYKLYEMGNNPFYIPSPSEVVAAQTAEAAEDKNQQNNDINIEG